MMRTGTRGKELYRLGKHKLLNLVGARSVYGKGNRNDVGKVSIKMKREKCVKTNDL